ncbi:hypothetical protein M427DRAFT_39098 [Gonapodya prolifera JEL478]|uniref:Uncharacterized protein n=1 Tax=Gonapodya prolifera (strain JEL478) TaxID=1344416 RepID=A0A138ZZ34_GONPJ|nr:hypothetical protein M427DRAFT_39098 [Gonapodya prolifera JEL478]|eukprot:KXS09393.1 hypothetical protein M427DRAFT_39098 [Gonapodya prolifera JEL478]
MATKRTPFSATSDGDKTVLDEDVRLPQIFWFSGSQSRKNHSYVSKEQRGRGWDVSFSPRPPAPPSHRLSSLSPSSLSHFCTLLASSPSSSPRLNPAPPRSFCSSLPTALSHFASATSLVLAVFSLSVDAPLWWEKGKDVVEGDIDRNPRSEDIRPRLPLLAYIPLIMCALAGYASTEMHAVWSIVEGLEKRRYKVKGA